MTDLIRCQHGIRHVDDCPRCAVEMHTAKIATFEAALTMHRAALAAAEARVAAMGEDADGR